MEIFLAKLLGVYFVIIGIIVLARQKAVIPTLKELSKSRALLLVVAAVELAAGIGLVLTYPTVSVSLVGVFSVIGYMMVIEAIIYLAAPSKFVQKLIGSFNTPSWHLSGGVVALVAGAFLAGTGFGYF
ncbi:MAG: hypothetical protein AB199_02860 [Parcubacteria bacterium C7867-004]|nr:MAG: hypothetical protein AB199_02860 [Parcubacteria bacterium C7867-004]